MHTTFSQVQETIPHFPQSSCLFIVFDHGPFCNIEAEEAKEAEEMIIRSIFVTFGPKAGRQTESCIVAFGHRQLGDSSLDSLFDRLEMCDRDVEEQIVDIFVPPTMEDEQTFDVSVSHVEEGFVGSVALLSACPWTCLSTRSLVVQARLIGWSRGPRS